MTAPANVIGSSCPREGEEQSRQYRGGSLLDELVTKRRYLTLWRALALQDNVVRALVRIVTLARRRRWRCHRKRSPALPAKLLQQFLGTGLHIERQPGIGCDGRVLPLHRPERAYVLDGQA